MQTEVSTHVVETLTGTTFTGYIHRVSTSPYILAVFKTAFRRITPYGGPQYQSENPKWALDLTDLIAVIVNPVSVQPASVGRTERLPYGLTKKGDWWQGVKVPYITVNSESAEKEIP